MGCTRTSLRRLGRKKYPLVRHVPNLQYVTSQGLELENIIADIINSDIVTVAFEEPFSEIPSVVANFVPESPVGNVNVFVEAASKTHVTIRTSSVITGKIHVHAMYIQGCGPASYTIAAPEVIAPTVLSLPIIDDPQNIASSFVTISPALFAGTPTPSETYAIFLSEYYTDISDQLNPINGVYTYTPIGWDSVSYSSLSTFTIPPVSLGGYPLFTYEYYVYIVATATNDGGTVMATSNTAQIPLFF